MHTSSQPDQLENTSSKARRSIRIICVLTAIMILLPFFLIWLTGAIKF